MTTKAYPAKPVHQFTFKSESHINRTKRGFKKAKIKELKEHISHKLKVKNCLEKLDRKTKREALGHAFIWSVNYLRYKYVVGSVCSNDLNGIISGLQEKFPNDDFWYNLD